MAPILKDLEAPVAVATTLAPAAPHPKGPADAPARTQPVALEIPVTVNGAHTVVGSDKREPFSESTQTVLVFPLGAVIRIATPLAPGQLVFLTNEKTKKEVVCQVVKSKAAGPNSAYVELQFTEPSPSFWGLQVPTAPAAPLAPRLATPAAPAVPKAIPPAPPVAAIPPAPKPVAPPAIPAPPAKPVVVAPPPPIEKPEPAIPRAVAPAIPVPEVPVAPPTVAVVPEPPPAPTVAPADAPAPVEVAAPPPAPPQAVVQEIPPAPVAPKAAALISPLRDYSKAIEALFAVPQAPAAKPPAPPAPEPDSTPAASTPSTEELKLHTARLQEQLSSLLFSEAPAAPASASTPASAVTATPEAPLAEVVNKVLEIAQEKPLPLVKSEPVPVPPVYKPVSTSFAHEEEVKIPAWLAPLSQVSETSGARSAASSVLSSEAASAVSANSEESYEALNVDAPHRASTAVFGGQLLGESAAQADQTSSSGSKKGLFIGLAAAAVLVLGGGGWYFRQNFFASAPATTIKPVGSSSTSPVPISKLPAAAAPAPAAKIDGPESVASAPSTPQPSKSTTPVMVPAVSAAAPETKILNPVPRNEAPVEPPKKSGLGEVHLSAPVVNRAADSQQPGEALPSVETDSSSAGADPLAVVSSAHTKQPAVPVPIGGDVKTAQLLKSVPPVYPPMARTQHVSGNVQVDALIDAKGNVASVKVISGSPILQQAALDAVKEWKYSPAMLNGEPTTMHLTVTVQFRAQ